MNQPLTALLVAILSLGAMPGLADAEDGAVAHIEGQQTIVDQPSRSVPHGQTVATENLSTLYSNFNENQAYLYDCCTAWTIWRDAHQGNDASAVAMPFALKVSATIKQVRVAVGHVRGDFNGATVSINDDANGAPGKVLAKMRATGLMGIGDCCETSSLTSDVGMPAHAGIRYWLVVSAPKKFGDVWNGWNQNSVGLTDQPLALFIRGEWNSRIASPGAFAIYGSPGPS
jgi:hypothetical protein